jgi:Flp pilus assembly protein TadD
VLWPTHRRLVLAGLTALVLLGGVLLAGLNLGMAPSSRLAQLPYVGRIVELQNPATGTARVRLVLWQAALRVVTAWPEIGLQRDPLHALRPLLGYGPDTASIVYTANYPPELAHIEDPGAVWDRAHNEPLDLLAMYGWLGLVALGVLGVACARRGLALWRAAPDAAGRAWAAAPLAALLAHAVEVQFAFTLTATGLMAWLSVAWLATPPSPNPLPSPEFGREEGAGGRGEGLRWRIYAATGALLLTLAAVRLEGGLLWADTLVARAGALDQAGQWQESLALYNRALMLIPWQATTHQFRGEALYNLARALPDEQAALKADLLAAADRSLARARQLEPLELEYYSNAGILHAYWSDTLDPAHLETAVAFYEQAFRLAPTRAELGTDLGHVYHNHGLYEEALAQYRAALEIDPRFAQAYYGSGLAWQALGRRDLARQAFRAALDLAPECNACREALEELGE